MSKIIERIQKLLRLASNAGSEAEAALAAQRAADMMAEHEIQEAELALASEEPRKVDPIQSYFEVTKTSKKVAWHMRVTYGVAKAYGAEAFWSGGRVMLFGRLSAVQATKYTAHYLMRQVEKITDREAPSKQYSKMYRNAFRLGCARRIEQRILDEIEAKKLAERKSALEAQRKAAYEEARANGDVDGMLDNDMEDLIENVEEEDLAADEQETAAATPVNTMALAIVEKDKKEVEEAFEKFSSKWGAPARVGRVSSGSGYNAGRSAGDRVNLGMSGGKGLPRGQDSLR